jgi:hypothetical protein
MKRDSVRVADCSIGRGLFAERHFKRGDLILNLGGPRYDRAHPIHGTEGGANLIQTGWRTYIMPDSPGVFTNHSCNPNAGIASKRRLVAIRHIAPGDEILFHHHGRRLLDHEVPLWRPTMPGRGTGFQNTPSPNPSPLP